MANRVFVKIKDWDIKGFQLQKTYLDDWLVMKDTFHRFGLDINIHGPLITMNEAKNVRTARIVTSELFKDFELTKKEIFLTILRTLPKYSRIKTERDFSPWIKENLLALSEINYGTLKETDEAFERKVRELIGK